MRRSAWADRAAGMVRNTMSLFMAEYITQERGPVQHGRVRLGCEFGISGTEQAESGAL